MRMLELMLMLCIGVAAPSAAADLAQPFDRQAQISEAITKVRAVAMNADKVDWTAIERDALKRTEGAKDTVDLLPAYYLIVRSLGDHHSNMIPTEPQFQAWMMRYKGRRYLPDTPPPILPTSGFAQRKPVAPRQLPLAAGAYATVVTVTASNARDEDHGFADRIYNGIIDKPGCGFIIDLQGNTGGNTFPMLAGVSALLGDGFRMEVPSPSGQPHTYMLLKGGVAEGHMEGAPAIVPLAGVSHWKPTPVLKDAPVAVLIDDATASAGEGVAVAFRGRTATRFFGVRTAGQASANEIITLSDGVVLAVTAGLLVDRNGRPYPDGVKPDEPVSPSRPGDAVLLAAASWLRDLPECTESVQR